MDSNYARYIAELIKQKHFSRLTPAVREEARKDIHEYTVDYKIFLKDVPLACIQAYVE